MTEKYSIENINPDSGTEYLDFSPGDKTVNNVMQSKREPVIIRLSVIIP